MVDHKYVTSPLLNRQIVFYDDLTPKKNYLSLITLILMFILFQVMEGRFNSYYFVEIMARQ